MLFCYYDCESDSGHMSKASVLSISGVLVSDESDKPVEKFTLYSRPRKSRPIEVDAMLVNGLDLDFLSKQDTYGVMLKKLVEILTKWKNKGAIFVGYNNLNYDSQLINHSLFVNLRWPYLLSGGQGQFDLLPVVRAAQVFVPNAIKYELNEKNLPIFKLASICKANNIPIKAHDSLGDCLGTYETGKLLANKAPEVFKASLLLRNKQAVGPSLKGKIVCWMEAWRVAKIYCGCSLGEGIFPGWFLMYDLRKDPEEILSILKDTSALSKALDASPKFLRVCKSNRAPLLMNKKYALLDKTYKELGMKELERRQKVIEKNKDEILSRIKAIQQERLDEKREHDQSKLEPEQMIYKLNPSIDERKIMDAFNLADTIQEKKKLFNMFKRDEIKTLAEMVIYEEHSEEEFIKILSKRDYTKIKKRIANFILSTDGDEKVFTNIPNQFARLDTLRVQAENDEDNEKMKKLDKLDKYLVQMQAEYERYV